ncbi:MAG: SgcJ/EcaC family oxidoreductase [Chitinophagaceae bacterium]|nr:SgcJ/EcaC family oxidoreductase [Chitinophagaceae bacterium]
MHKFRGFLCISLFFLNCTNNNTVSKEEEKKIITEISAARAKAFNEGNAAGIAEHFTDDAWLMAPEKSALRGKDAVKSYYQAIFDEYNTKLESRYDEVDLSGDIAYGRGFARVTLFPMKGGDSIVSTAKYLNILRKQADGSWKTTHDIWNGNEKQ